MPAIAAVYEKRLELALKGNLQAIKSCCEDARMYGLLKDPLITSLSGIISPSQLLAMTTEQIEFLQGLLTAALFATPQEHEFNETPKDQNPGFYTVKDEVTPGRFNIYRPPTAREALAVAVRITGLGRSVRILSKEFKELSEDDLRKLAHEEGEL
jgi:hypothetical protein